MNTFYENDTHRVPQYRMTPKTPEEITRAQTEIENYISMTNENRIKSGLPLLTEDQKIHCFVRLRIPVPERYQQNN